LEHCAIRRSSTGLPPLAEITHSQYHGRSNALEDKHGVAYHRLFNKHVLLDETYSLCRGQGARSRSPPCAAPTSLRGVTSAPSCFSSRPRRQLDQCARVLDVVINCNLKDWKALFDFQACRMCGLRCGKVSLRLLVNLEEITFKLGSTVLLSTTSFPGSLLRSCVSILT
jgi:hypothetical protein